MQRAVLWVPFVQRAELWAPVLQARARVVNRPGYRPRPAWLRISWCYGGISRRPSGVITLVYKVNRQDKTIRHLVVRDKTRPGWCVLQSEEAGCLSSFQSPVSSLRTVVPGHFRIENRTGCERREVSRPVRGRVPSCGGANQVSIRFVIPFTDLDFLRTS